MKKPKMQAFSTKCTSEQNKLIKKELKAKKLVTGQSYAFIIIEALYKLRGEK